MLIDPQTMRPRISTADAQRMMRDQHIDIAFTEDEKATIVNGLYVAARRFDEDAETARAAGHPLMVEQFERQAKDSRAIAARLE
jgi:hypothetical protein